MAGLARAVRPLASTRRAALALASPACLQRRASLLGGAAAAALPYARPPPSRFTHAAAAAASLPRRLASISEAVEILDAAPASPTRLMLTCEHASMRLPAPWQWPSGDSRLLGTHWSYDPGAESFTRLLHARVSSVCVLSRFSRLLCDPNRPLGAETMFRSVADGQPVLLNEPQRLTAEEVQRRVETLYEPYHAALRQVAEAIAPVTILAPHSFTPVYEGQKREMEIGVLYNSERDRALADKFVSAFTSAGIPTALNAPWSAKDGFMFAADQFASPRTAVIMFEFRQDVIAEAEWMSKVVECTEKVLREIGHK